jgi:hypothetical protein
VRILFDQGVPLPLRRSFSGHVVITAWQKGWSELSNGELLAAADADGFELLVTTDQNLRYQQNLPCSPLRRSSAHGSQLASFTAAPGSHCGHRLKHEIRRISGMVVVRDFTPEKDQFLAFSAGLLDFTGRGTLTVSFFR